jgi:hypothetical protein
MSVLAETVSNGNKASGIVASVMLFLFNFFFAVGMLAIPWLLPSEYAPLAVRTPIAALSSASNWIFTFRKCSSLKAIVLLASVADQNLCALQSSCSSLPYRSGA